MKKSELKSLIKEVVSEMSNNDSIGVFIDNNKFPHSAQELTKLVSQYRLRINFVGGASYGVNNLEKYRAVISGPQGQLDAFVHGFAELDGIEFFENDAVSGQKNKLKENTFDLVSESRRRFIVMSPISSNPAESWEQDILASSSEEALKIANSNQPNNPTQLNRVKEVPISQMRNKSNAIRQIDAVERDLESKEAALKNFVDAYEKAVDTDIARLKSAEKTLVGQEIQESKTSIKKSELKALIREVVDSIEKENYKEQMERELRSARKKKDAEKELYYTQAFQKGDVAVASFDKQFKGSWAYDGWKKKYAKEISDIEARYVSDKRRFGWMGESDSIRSLRWKDGLKIDIDHMGNPVGYKSLGMQNSGIKIPDVRDWRRFYVSRDGNTEKLLSPKLKVWYEVDSSG